MLTKKKLIPKILENYLDYLIAIKGCSLNTSKAFSSDIMLFFTFVQKYKNIPVSTNSFNIFIILQIKESDVFAFLVYLNYSRDNNAYTRQRRITAIKSFYKWIFSVYPKITSQKMNPTLGIPFIRKIERLPQYLKLSQAKEIQNIFNPSNTRFPKRNNAIITLFLSSGIRLSELINIDIADINFDNNIIIIFRKK